MKVRFSSIPHILSYGLNNKPNSSIRFSSNTDPILIDTGLTLNGVAWNPFGSILAVCGAQDIVDRGDGERRRVNQIQFYDNSGNHLRTLRVPGTNLTGFDWDNTGLRLALTVDSYIFFANVRPDYKWGSFRGKSLVYSYRMIERPEHCVTFWNYKTDERHTKHVRRLVDLRVSGEHCCLMTETDHPSHTGQKAYLLILCNSIGNPMASKYVPYFPSIMEMSS